MNATRFLQALAAELARIPEYQDEAVQRAAALRRQPSSTREEVEGRWQSATAR